MSNDFASFKDLPADLQREALREGELRLQAQLAVATSADQRALTWAGLVLVAVTGSLGGGVALLGKESPDFGLATFALTFASSMMGAAWRALATVQPGLFCLPGNKPSNWLPEHWDGAGTENRWAVIARTEQAEQMSRHIEENAQRAAHRAREMQASFAIVGNTLYLAAIAFFGLLAFRYSTAA
ncbi:hypothetical protein [Tsuneonella sp. SYSU-LHT278]|uniref:hypothetical protein n=1 Tax=Tsuneonella sediminis TaxID=3416089 RepID=UPI003F79A53A